MRDNSKVITAARRKFLPIFAIRKKKTLRGVLNQENYEEVSNSPFNWQIERFSYPRNFIHVSTKRHIAERRKLRQALGVVIKGFTEQKHKKEKIEPQPSCPFRRSPVFTYRMLLRRKRSTTRIVRSRSQMEIFAMPKHCGCRCSSSCCNSCNRCMLA